MARKIAVLNQKGGVGKTTLTTNLAAALATLGNRVLLVDLDPQGDLSTYLGIDPETELTMFDVFDREDLDIRQVLQQAGNMSILPTNIDLATIEAKLITRMNREKILGRRLTPIVDNYDFILIDCPPSLGLLTLNALAFVDEVVIPLQTQFLAAKALAALQSTVEDVRREGLNPELRIGGIVRTLFEGHRSHDKAVVELIRDGFGDLMFNTALRKDVNLAAAPSYGQTIFEYAPQSRAAQDFLALAQEYLERMGARSEEVA